MAHDPRLRGARQRALHGAPRCPASRTSTSARRPSRSACARRSATTTTSPARTAATATAWPRAPRSTACSPSCSARRPGYCRGKGGSMHIADQRAATWARTPSSAAAPASRPAPPFGASMRGTGQVAVCFFGDGALGPGPALRGHEHGVALEAARGLRLREQPLQRVHALPRDDGGRACRARRGVRHPGARRSTARTCARCTRPRPRSSSAARRGDGPVVARVRDLPLLRPPRRRRRPRLLPLREEEEAWRSERDPLELLRRRGSSSRRPREAAATSREIEARVRQRSRHGVAFALAAPYPDDGRGRGRMSTPSGAADLSQAPACAS